MPAEFVRARCAATGAVAALPGPAVELGMCPGWETADGPVPDKPKPAADTASGGTRGTKNTAGSRKTGNEEKE